jgi:hypothetical protein
MHRILHSGTKILRSGTWIGCRDDKEAIQPGQCAAGG